MDRRLRYSCSEMEADVRTVAVSICGLGLLGEGRDSRPLPVARATILRKAKADGVLE
jgi:hypothetical protein